MKKTVLHDNGYSHILLDSSTIQYLRDVDNMFSPRSVKVWSGMQIELGRPVSELIECLSKTRVPIIIKSVALPIKGMLGYQLIRMHTGNISDKVLANIVEKDNTIIKLTFNREIANDKEFRRYSQVPVVNQLKIKALNINNSSELELHFKQQLDMIISSLFRNTATFIKADYTPGAVDVYVSADGQLQKVSLLYSKKTDYYELVSISLEQ